MIHEGMLLEYSGRSLGLMLWGASVRQLLVLGLLADIFFPWGVPAMLSVRGIILGLAVFLVKTVLIGVLLACVETAFTKMRLFKVPEMMSASFMLSVMALMALIVYRL